jgi:hypothetical protein
MTTSEFCTVTFNDLLAYDTTTMIWRILGGIPPPSRQSPGFAASEGLLYVHAGTEGNHMNYDPGGQSASLHDKMNSR